MHVAAKYGKIEVANLLLQKRAPPDAAGKVKLSICTNVNRLAITTFNVQCYRDGQLRSWRVTVLQL